MDQSLNVLLVIDTAHTVQQRALGWSHIEWLPHDSVLRFLFIVNTSIDLFLQSDGKYIFVNIHLLSKCINIGSGPHIQPQDGWIQCNCLYFSVTPFHDVVTTYFYMLRFDNDDDNDNDNILFAYKYNNYNIWWYFQIKKVISNWPEDYY